MAVFSTFWDKNKNYNKFGNFQDWDKIDIRLRYFRFFNKLSFIQSFVQMISIAVFVIGYLLEQHVFTIFPLI